MTFTGRATPGAERAKWRFVSTFRNPDLKPIELAFSKFKKLLRDGAQCSTEALSKLCGQLLDLFTEGERRNHIRHAAYRYSELLTASSGSVRDSSVA